MDKQWKFTISKNVNPSQTIFFSYIKKIKRKKKKNYLRRFLIYLKL